MSEDNARPEPIQPPILADDQAPASPFPKEDLPAIGQEAPEVPNDDAFVWTASEYIAHHKDTKYYATVIAIAIPAAVLAYVITSDIITGFALLVLGILFCLAAARKPRILTYALDDHGVTIGPRYFPYGGFKSFSVVREGAFANIELIPLKRFMPVTSVFCPPEMEEDVVAILADHVPYEERPAAMIDRFGRHIRF